MPRTTEIQVGVGKTVNMGNYESLRIDVWERITLDEGEDVVDECHKARIKLSQRVDQMVKKEVNDRDSF